MKQKVLNTAILIALMVAGIAVNAGAGGRTRAVRHAQRATPAGVAIAALSPVGAAEGWGRIQAADISDGQQIVRRSVTVQLFGLEPSSEYTVNIDEVVLGQVYTDSRGWARLMLGLPGDRFPPVPAELPPAAELQSAVVTDASGAFVLEGSFVLVGDGWMGRPEYVERILLDDVAGTGARGIAKVESEGDGDQSFDSRATGLIPGDQYTIIVDGYAAGLVTADAVGQARLHLEAGDAENPLPPELQPVQDIRQVEWRDAAGDAVLSGSFTGTPDNGGDHRFYAGPITEMVANGFTLITEMGPFKVIIDENTVFENFASLDDLAIGDIVKVEGSLDGDTITASKVELMDHNDGGGDMDTFGGPITAIAADGFSIQNGMGSYQVVITPDTIFENFASLDDLAVGDIVKVEGSLDGDTITAATIELENHGGGGGGGHH